MRRRAKSVLISVVAVVALLAILTYSFWPNNFDVDVERVGGRVDHYGDSGPVASLMQGLGIGVDFSSNVVRLDNTAVADEWLAAHHGELSRLRHVDLHLDATPITDEGVRSLTDLPELRAISLARTRVTDRAMEYLAGSSLIYLDIAHTDVSDAGLAHAASMPLQGIAIDGAQVTESGLRFLKDCSRLRSLEIEDADDAVAARITGWTHLHALTLQGENVTDDAVLALRTLTGLRVLHLLQSRVTQAALTDLQQALPNCSIPGVE